MDDELIIQVRKSEEVWRASFERLKQIERTAHQNPSATASAAKKWIFDERNSLAKILYIRFGTNAFADEGHHQVKVFGLAAPENVPEDLREFQSHLVDVVNYWEFGRHTVDLLRALFEDVRKNAGGGEAEPEFEDLVTGEVNPFVTTIFPDPWRSRRHENWANEFIEIVHRLLLVVTTRSFMYEAEQEAKRRGEDPDQALCEAYLRNLSLWGPVRLVVCEKLRHSVPKQAAAVGLAGWVKAQTKTEWLKTSEEELLRDLPSLTLIACSERPSDEKLSPGLRNRVTCLFDQARRDEKNRAGERQIDPTQSISESEDLDRVPEHSPEALPGVQLFLTQEAVRQDFEERVKRYGLAKREAEVATLRFEGKRTHEIADMMGIEKATVRATESRIRAKAEAAEAEAAG